MLVYRVPNDSSKSGEALSTSDLERFRSFLTSPPNTGCRLSVKSITWYREVRLNFQIVFLENFSLFLI
jgi:hypothetical protein